MTPTQSEPQMSYDTAVRFAAQLALCLEMFVDRISAAEGDYRHEQASMVLTAYGKATRS